jgi:hypothetical protein
MANIGRRHRLILYTYSLNRWWRAILGIGIVLLALVAAVVWVPTVLPEYTPPQIDAWILWLAGGVGAFAIFLAIFLIAVRKSAYVQPYKSYLRLATPFLRMNISYRRIRQVSNAEMGSLFHFNKLRGQKRTFLAPLAGLTVLVLDLNGMPLPRWTLKFFLSPYFFPDRTARLALLVPDWIRFSTELDSFRSSWIDSLRKPSGTPQSDLLASLSGNRSG